MMEAEFDVPPLRVIRIRSNAKRDFDRRDKRRLVEACLRPGVSVAGMALKLGINTNQLRKWIRLHQVANEAAAARSTLPAFVPVVEVSDVTHVTEPPVVRGRPPAEASARTQPSQRPSLTPALLRARLAGIVFVYRSLSGTCSDDHWRLGYKRFQTTGDDSILFVSRSYQVAAPVIAVLSALTTNWTIPWPVRLLVAMQGTVLTALAPRGAAEHHRCVDELKH